MTSRSGRSEALALLGIAQRAGAVLKGTDATRRGLRNGEVRLVIVAEDGSPAQKKKILPLAGARAVEVSTLGTRNELGGAVGRGPLTAVGITHPGFEKELRERLKRE